MKKILGYLIILLINYLLISLVVFSFSLISLKNDKVYDILWIKYVQKKIYDMTGYRNVFQHSTNDCVEFDKNLIYVPKIDIQKQIVEKLEAERKIVEGNKKLIEIYSKKIEDRINKIWGD